MSKISQYVYGNTKDTEPVRWRGGHSVGNPDNLSSVPRAHKVEGESQLLQVSLRPSCMLWECLGTRKTNK